MFTSILRSHMARYPEMQIQDVYKLIHQAAMGNGHAVPDPSTAREWLERELAEMGAGPVEPLADPISADGEMLRVHLRPYLSSVDNVEALLDAFIRTANAFAGKTETLEANWDSAVRTRLWPATVMNEFIVAMRAQNYPAVHHSEDYRQKYKPAYRVVRRKYFPYQEIGD